MIHANLFVQAHSEIALILLAKCDLYQSEHAVRSLVSVFYSSSPQGQGHHNSVGQLLWAYISQPTPSTFSVGGNLEYPEKTYCFWQSLLALFSYED